MKVDSLERDSLLTAWDCVWIGFTRRVGSLPIHGRDLHLIDWQMGGTLSRFVMNGDAGPVFVPTMRRLPFALLCLEKIGEAPALGIELVAASAVKNEWKKLLFMSENSQALEGIRSLLFKTELSLVSALVHVNES